MRTNQFITPWLIVLPFMLLMYCNLALCSSTTAANHLDLWKRADDKHNSQNDLSKKRSSTWLSESVKQFQRFKDKGLIWKGVSNFGVLADQKTREAFPKVEVQNGRKAGHVISWVLQHPSEAKVHNKQEQYRGHAAHPIPPYAKSDVHQSGFVETDFRSPKEHGVVGRLSKLMQEGHRVVHMTSSSTQSDPSSANKYPYLNVKSGNQHSRVLSAFLDDGKDTKIKSRRQPKAQTDTPTRNLIDRLGKRPMSPGASSSPSSDSEADSHRDKMPRKS